MDQIEEFREEDFRRDLAIPELIEEVLESTGYKAELKAEGEVEAETRLENIEELVNKAAAYEADAEEPNLDEFLEEVALVADVDRMDESEDRVYSHDPSQRQRTGIPQVCIWRPGGRAVPQHAWPSIPTIRKRLEEERRLCYVGITRARKAPHPDGGQTADGQRRDPLEQGEPVCG